jgi:peptide/nickel transport system substrate-binding protein
MHKTIRTWVLPVGVTLWLAFVFAMPAKASEKDPLTLRILLWQAPTTLNPHILSGSKDQVVTRIIYEPLATFDANGKLVPFLAAEIPSRENGEVAADGKSVIWKLKRGVKWSDGQPFTAKDVVFTYNYVNNPDVGSSDSSDFGAVEKVDAIDDVTVKITFKKVNPAWMLPFVGAHGLIIPEHVFAAFNNATAATAPVNFAPVGTGPYIASEFLKEDVLLIGDNVVNTVKIIYKPNPYYRDPGKLHFKQVIVQGGGDTTVAAKAVLSEGIVDYAWNLQLDSKAWTDLEAKGVGKLVFMPSSYIERIVINFTDPNRETADGERSSLQVPHPYLTDPRVREALAYAIDREKIAQLYGRSGRATANILVAPPAFESPNTRSIFDTKRAAALLDQAGWIDSDGDGVRDKNGLKLSLVFDANINPVRQQIQEIIKQDFESIGVQVETKMFDSSIFFGDDPSNPDTSDHFYADLETFKWGNRSPDPGVYMESLTCGEAPQKSNSWGKLNTGRYCNPEYDALYEKSTTELDPEKRRQLFIQMNDLAMHDVALIPLVASTDVSGLGNDIEGFSGTPWDSETWNIADWYRKQ